MGNFNEKDGTAFLTNMKKSFLSNTSRRKNK